jgi:hypothetical protein
MVRCFWSWWFVGVFSPKVKASKETDIPDMKTELSSLFILLTFVGLSEESVFSSQVSFKSLKSNLGNCYHHNLHVAEVVSMAKLVGDW